MSADDVIQAFRDEFRALRAHADQAIEQLGDDQLFEQLDEEANSVAHLMKHVGGNLRSRWTDVFTTDGEKPDRRRDDEFERHASDTRATIDAAWNGGWVVVLEALDAIVDADLQRVVVIRGQSLTLSRALTRSLAHTAGHVHQIVLLAKHWRGASWRTLSLPRGRSEQVP
jgi:hypothetical protein